MKKRISNITQFEEILQFEVLKSEKIKISIIIVILLIVSFLWFFMILIFGYEFIPLQNISGTILVYGLSVFLLCALAYESMMLIALKFIMHRKVRPPELVRYGHALVEISFPTIILMIFASSMNPVIALNVPPFVVYYFLIILSTLHLRFYLSLFTGIVSGIEYFIISYIYLPGDAVNEVEIFFQSIMPVVTIKSILFIVGGVVAGFVANEIRKQLTNSIQLLNERDNIKNMFGQYVSPDVVEKLLNQEIEFTGEVRYVAIMFFDVRDFTKFSEKKLPKEVIEYLNTLFGDLITIINQNNGIINKFLGDGFMAVFGAPISDNKDVKNAVKSAIEIVKKVDELNQNGVIPTTRIGIGIHSGEAVTGNVGSQERKEYAIIGDTVNLASRIEQLNKKYKSVLLVTDTVFNKIKDEYRGEKLPPVKVKGRDEPVQIYKIL